MHLGLSFWSWYPWLWWIKGKKGKPKGNVNQFGSNLKRDRLTLPVNVVPGPGILCICLRVPGVETGLEYVILEYPDVQNLAPNGLEPRHGSCTPEWK